MKLRLSQPVRLTRCLNPTQAQQDSWPTNSTSKFYTSRCSLGSSSNPNSNPTSGSHRVWVRQATLAVSRFQDGKPRYLWLPLQAPPGPMRGRGSETSTQGSAAPVCDLHVRVQVRGSGCWKLLELLTYITYSKYSHGGVYTWRVQVWDLKPHGAVNPRCGWGAVRFGQSAGRHTRFLACRARLAVGGWVEQLCCCMPACVGQACKAW